MVTNALAVHDTGAFELDGNATNGAAAAGDDWDNVCHQVTGSDCSTTDNTTGATAVDWVSEPNTNASIFTTGGSKDPQDLTNWQWKDGAGGLPDKDNLLHSFAARYSTSAGQVLFFGSDRLDNSGDAQQGFWFFQNPITLNGITSGGFNGVHKTGDVLVVSDFSNGGTTSTITVYSWDPACTKTTGSTVGTCGDANLRIKGTSTAANCATAAANDQFCGIVNANAITMPWSFTDKSGTPNNQALNGEFYEGGVNLTALGLGDKCFSSVAAETRSSTSTTATLKDFILGKFGTCTTTLSTNANATQPLSIGTGTVSSGTDTATLTINGVSSWGGTMTWYLCGPLGATDGCDAHGVSVTSRTVSNSSPATDFVSGTADLTSAGRYCWHAHFEPDQATKDAGVSGADDDGTNECFTVSPVTPTLSTSASCSASPCVPGSTLSDTATLSGTANQPGTNGPGGDTGLYKSIKATNGAGAGGQITWTAFGPNDCTTVAMAATSRDVSGDNTYPTATQNAVGFTANAPGTYTFVASYNGNSPNTNSVPATACPDPSGNEAVTVSDTTSSSSAQTWLPNDTGTVAADHGAPLNGTLSIQLYTGDNCGVTSGSAVSGQLYTKTLTNATTVAARTLTTANTSFTVETSRSVSWLVTFTSTDANVAGSSHCESTSLTITN